MGKEVVSPLRQRMIEDMNARKLGKHSQRSHIHSCKRFAAFLKRSPETPRFPALALFGRRPSECAERPSFRRPKTCTKTDNLLIMTAEQGSQTEREPRVAGKQWPTGVRRGIRRSSDRLLPPA